MITAYGEKEKMIIHKCKGSLANNVSIRWEKRLPGLDIKDDVYAWRAYCYVWDSDYDVYLQRHFAVIQYCPFCGKLLEEIDDERDKSD